MGGLASMPIVGKLQCQSETVQEGIASGNNAKLYEMVIAKVMKEGKRLVSLVEWKGATS